MTPGKDRAQLLMYLFLAFGFSSLSYILMARSGHVGSAGGLYVVTLMWSPALAAMVACKGFGQSLDRLGWKWGETRYQVASYFIPLLYATIAYVCVWSFHGGGFYDHAFITHVGERFGLGELPQPVMIVVYLLFSGTAGMIISCAHALGEEIGWRGFLVPQLARRFNYTATSLISGVIWSLWHYPVLIFSDYNSGTPTWFALICFTVMVISMSFIFAWFRLKSGNLWTCVLLHASHNLFIQQFFDPMTTDTGRTRYFIGEFGIALPLISIAFGFYFWTRRKELPNFGGRLASQ